MGGGGEGARTPAPPNGTAPRAADAEVARQGSRSGVRRDGATAAAASVWGARPPSAAPGGERRRQCPTEVVGDARRHPCGDRRYHRPGRAALCRAGAAAHWSRPREAGVMGGWRTAGRAPPSRTLPVPDAQPHGTSLGSGCPCNARVLAEATRPAYAVCSRLVACWRAPARRGRGERHATVGQPYAPTLPSRLRKECPTAAARPLPKVPIVEDGIPAPADATAAAAAAPPPRQRRRPPSMTPFWTTAAVAIAHRGGGRQPQRARWGGAPGSPAPGGL